MPTKYDSRFRFLYITLSTQDFVTNNPDLIYSKHKYVLYIYQLTKQTYLALYFILMIRLFVRPLR